MDLSLRFQRIPDALTTNFKLTRVNLRQFTVCLIGVVLLLGCASAPTVVVVTYGPFKNHQPQVVEIVENAGAVVEIQKIDPPSGAIGPVVIHGDSPKAQRLAKQIAYDIYAELGTWVAVRAVQLTNHSYSRNHVGLYLLDEASAKNSEQDIRDSVEISPSNEFLPANCTSFDGVIELSEENLYMATGVVYDADGEEKNVSVSGQFYRSTDHVEFVDGDRVHQYVAKPVKWTMDAVTRIRLNRRESGNDVSGIFSCDFIQDLQVTPTTSS